MKKIVHFIILCCFALITHAKLYAQPGSLDKSFNDSGKVITKVLNATNGNYYNSQINALALQNDGKIVIGGLATNNFLTGRYLQNGKLDQAFAVNGFRFNQISDRESGTPETGGVAVQNDGKIILAGSTTNGSYESFRLLRFFPDGSVDFINRIADFGNRLEEITSYGFGVALLSDQTIIEVGSPDFAIAKYKTDGYLDSSYGTNGKVVTDLDEDATALAVAVEPNDEIVLAGFTGHYFSNTNIALAKYKTNGTLDSSFGVNGIVTTDLNGSEFANAVKIQPDGKIVIAGTTNVSGSTKFLAIRYLSNGTIDNSFGTNGVATTSFGSGSADNCTALAIYNNRILLGGYTNANDTTAFALAQFNMNGTLDNSFGTNGKTTTTFGSATSAAALVVQSDGKILMAGTTTVRFKGSDLRSLALARYNGSSNNVADTTVKNVSVCFTNLPYTYNGKNYDSSGTYFTHLTGVGGADSVIKLILTVLSPGFTAKLTTNRPAICKGEYATLTANTTKGVFPFLHSIDNGVTYQASKQFKEHTGTYKVLVKDANGCVATTNTVTIIKSTACSASAAIADLAQTANASVSINAFPNPSVNDFVVAVKGGKTGNIIQLKVTDMSGKVVYQTKGFSNSNYRFGKNFVSGVYAVQMFDGKNVQTIKIVKN